LVTKMFVRKNENSTLPTCAYDGDAGWDLASCETISLPPGARTLVNTGLQIFLPENTCGMVCSRSGLTIRGIIVLGAPGIIDRGYTGEIKVTLWNTGHNETFHITPGTRIAQLVVVQIIPPAYTVLGERGGQGYGSSTNKF
jgi:dUTP pyrophosphatase